MSENILWYKVLHAESRVASVLLSEYQWDYSVRYIDTMATHRDLQMYSPFGDAPILIADTVPYVGVYPIVEKMIEDDTSSVLINKDSQECAEVRRIFDFVLRGFIQQVLYPIYHERVLNHYIKKQDINMNVLLQARKRLSWFVKYLEQLIQERGCLHVSTVTLPDLVGGAVLSVLDYLDEIPWIAHQDLKIWYARLKSRQSFSSILSERFIGILPSKHYDNVDF